MFKIAWIEVAQMISAFRRNVIEKFLGQIAVRIDDADAMPERDVLEDEIAKQRRFTRAGLSDDVDVLPLVGSGYAKGLGLCPAFALSDSNVWFVVVHGPKTSRHSCRKRVSGC